MIIADDSRDKKASDVEEQPLLEQGSSSRMQLPPPPTFEEAVIQRTSIVDDLNANIYAPPGGEEAPPAFEPYHAEYFEADDGTIVSHDPHLNQDGACSTSSLTTIHSRLRFRSVSR